MWHWLLYAIFLKRTVSPLAFLHSLFYNIKSDTSVRAFWRCVLIFSNLFARVWLMGDLEKFRYLCFNFVLIRRTI